MGKKSNVFTVDSGATKLNTVGDDEGTTQKRKLNVFHIHIPIQIDMTF